MLYIYFILKLAREPSTAQVTEGYYSRRLPAHKRFYRETKFSLLKSIPTQLRISKPSKEHSRGSTKIPNLNLRRIGPGVSEL